MSNIVRNFSYITIGKILDDLWEERRKAGVSEDKLYYINKHGKKTRKLPISRLTFLRLEKRLNFPVSRKTSGRLQWRTYSEEQAEEVKRKIRREYNFN